MNDRFVLVIRLWKRCNPVQSHTGNIHLINNTVPNLDVELFVPILKNSYVNQKELFEINSKDENTLTSVNINS